MSPKRSIVLASAMLATALAAGCASKPPRPEAQLARAESSIVTAEQAGARQYAGANYDAARDKLGEAKRLADKGEMGTAAMLADQARVDADLSAARARHAAADKAAAEVRLGTETLQQESNRQATPAGSTP